MIKWLLNTIFHVLDMGAGGPGNRRSQRKVRRCVTRR
jgi:hypothetical protein